MFIQEENSETRTDPEINLHLVAEDLELQEPALVDAAAPAIQALAADDDVTPGAAATDDLADLSSRAKGAVHETDGLGSAALEVGVLRFGAELDGLPWAAAELDARRCG